jgi:hypothetical protein
MTTSITDDDPMHPLARPSDQHEREMTTREHLAAAMNQIHDLEKALAVQQSILTAHDAGEETIRVGRALLLNVTEDRAQAAALAVADITQQIERLRGTCQEIAKGFCVTMSGKTAYGRCVVDGGL